MAKFYGKIGFARLVEDSPGVWIEDVEERYYYGDVLASTVRYENSGNVNDNLNISNKISILSDSFANENLHSMKYIEFMATKWKINNIEILYPRLVLTIGGVYNGE
jgi:hypothetical protein